MDPNYRPGKGVHLELTEEVADWLTDVLYNVYEAFGSNTTYVHPEEAVQEIQDRLNNSDWQYTADSYGSKMTNTLELDNGQELRVSVVANKKGELRLDIRTWFDPEEA